METENVSVLLNVLSSEELDKIPKGIGKKIEGFYQEKLEEFLTSKALCETEKSKIEQTRTDWEHKIEELNLKCQDEATKFYTSQQSVKELRTELDEVKGELRRQQDAARRVDEETSRFRRDRNEAVTERDTLLNSVERKTIEIERLQADVRSLEQKLKSANTTKCEALARLEEIQSKEVSLDFKQKRIDKEMEMRDNQIRKLTEDLNRTLNDLQNVRREQNIKSMTIEAQLSQKTEELKIATDTIAHLTESNQELSSKAEDLAAKMLAHNEDNAKMMEHYKKELQSQKKLCVLYKEDVDDNKKQTDELANAVTELKKLLTEAADSFGELETKHKETLQNHEKELETKEKVIQSMREELNTANEMLKTAHEENLNMAVEKLAPTAAAASRMIRSGMSLTELYTMYVKTAEDLNVAKKENSKLQLQINNIAMELEEKAPEIQRQQTEYQNLKDANEEMTMQINKMIEEHSEVRVELLNVQDKLRYTEGENKKLRSERTDLSRQVCHLLREIEQMRGGFTSDMDTSIQGDMSASEVISKKLVTFSDIQELQENNMKLLLLVRDLGERCETLETAQNQMSVATYEAKIETYRKRLQEMQDNIDTNAQLMSNCIQQRDRYKKMYHDSMRSYGKPTVPGAGSFNGSLSGDNAEIGDEDMPSASSVSAISNETLVLKDKKIVELEERIKDVEKQYKVLKEEYECYRKEKLTNDKMLNEQFDGMRTEIRELSSKNIKLVSTVEYNNEQIKIQQKNTATYKKQIQTLEERNRNYETTIAKHEATIMYLKDETMSAQTKLAKAEVMVENLKQECRILKDAESRLQVEREILNRERQNQNLLLNNLEMIKVSMERSEADGRLRLETRLDETSRECSALRRRLQEEQDRFRELTGGLERQMETTKKRLEEETSVSETYQAELRTVREELALKTAKCDELSKKLQDLLSPMNDDHPMTEANKKIRDLEKKLDESTIESESLKSELETAREHLKQYRNMSEASEKQLKDLNELYTKFKTEAEKEIVTLKASESELKSKMEEIKTETSLKITGEQLNLTDADSELHKSQLELKDALTKLSENNKDLRELREKCTSLSEQLDNAEQKYANEMVQHSTDIQQLSAIKEEMQRIRSQFDELKAARDQAVEKLSVGENCWKDREKILNDERSQLSERLNNLNAQNAILLDQIQSLSTKLSLSVSAAVDKEESLNDSVMDTSIGNKTISEEDQKSAEQLFQIIKYLRKEKDIAIAQYEILRSGNVRVESELLMLKKKWEDTQSELQAEREKTETGVVTVAKHQEILRKLETLNAITDSNRVIREERDILNKKLKEITERLTKAEDELFPLQEKVRDLTVKVDFVNNENATLRTEAAKWRQRATLLVERSNKTSPDDWKRLQNERENLAKLLTNEKELLKKANEELSSVRSEKNQLDTEVANLTKQLTTTTESNKKHAEELDILRQAGVKMNNEITEIKKTLVQRDEDLKKLTDEVSTKERQLNDSKQKEAQIRMIAKKYKDSYKDIKAKYDEHVEAAKTKEDVAAGPSGDTNNVDGIEKPEANNEEIETIKKENEALKTRLEKSTSNSVLLQEAQKRIMQSNEAKTNMMKELTAAKAQIASFEENEKSVNEMKAQLEARISRFEKEHTDSEKEHKEVVARLTRENESLTMRLNQLNRQLGLQQVSKPSTSAVGASEKIASESSPRTANVKPMSGPSGQQSATVTPWRGGETPLASIRPMSVQPSSRTAAVLPTSQTGNVASIQGSSANPSTSVTALVPPQQQVHTTAGSNSNESMSSSPTSSHTDYMPATSSANVSVAAVPPMGSTSSTVAESSSQQENESAMVTGESSQVLVSGGQQQAVALVSPRIESVQINVAAPQVVEQAPSTSSTNTQQQSSSHQQASSSNTVSTSQAGGHKRPRDVEGDSSTDNIEPQGDKAPQNKRTRLQGGETFQGVSESGLNADIEYQVPTSSQRDQEDDVIIVDSEEEEDEGMADDGNVDEGTAEADDGPFEGYDQSEIYDQEEEGENYDEGEGPDIDDDNAPSANNEVDVDDDEEGNEMPNQSGTSSSTVQVAPDVETSSSTGVGQSSTSVVDNNQQSSNDVQQIQTITSGSGEAGSSTPQTWRVQGSRQQQQAAHLMLMQQGYEENSDDRIVPSTPTLYAPRRNDGESMNSPHPQVPHSARFTFNESSARTSSTSTTLMPEGIDDTRMDLSQLDESGASQQAPQQTLPDDREKNEATAACTTNNLDREEPVAGPSRVSDSQVPEISVTPDDEDFITESDDKNNEAENDDQSQGQPMDAGDDEGDEVSSADKAATPSENVMEEGSEAEVLETPSSNTRTRSMTRTTTRRSGRFSPRGGVTRAPITWQPEGSSQRPGPGLNRSGVQQGSGSPQRGFSPNQSQRNRGSARRARRSNANFPNMRNY